MKSEQKCHLVPPHRVTEVVGLSLWLSLLGHGKVPPRPQQVLCHASKKTQENRARVPATHSSRTS